MNTPATELDPRFSEPGAAPISWARTRAAIEAAELFWISTVRRDGRPHVTPLVAVWHEGALYFTTGPSEQKAHNLVGNPQVVLTTGTSDWRAGFDVVVEGRAERVTDAARLRMLAAAWREKWDGRWRFEVDRDGFRTPGHGSSHVYAVAPAKVLAYGKGTFGQTRHRF